MSISKRGRRKITVNDRLYVWFITDREELGLYRLPDNTLLLLYHLLHIISDDKKFHVTYAMGQHDLPEPYLPHLCVIGREFPHLLKAGAYVATPCWDDYNVTPRFVREIILWCLDENKSVVEVDRRGKALDINSAGTN